MTCRNSERNIEDAVLSISNQSIKPKYIIVINDGSTDRTLSALSHLKEKISNLHIITNPDLGYDIGRVVSNWNKAIKLTYEMNLEKTDFHLIATDDTVYEVKYAEKILAVIKDNPHIVIASGNFDDNRYVTPHGAGRFVNNKFFEKNNEFYPEKIGYESFILYKARKDGYDYKMVSDAKFRHIRELGQDHHFSDWGQSMKALGYHPLFVLEIFLIDFTKNKPIGRVGTISILYYYLTYKPNNYGYNSLYQKELRDYIRMCQINQFKNKIKRFPIFFTTYFPGKVTSIGVRTTRKN